MVIGGILLAAILALLMPTVAASQSWNDNDDRTSYSPYSIDDDSYSDDRLYYDDGTDDYDGQYTYYDSYSDDRRAPYNDGSEDDVYYNSPAYYDADRAGVPYAGKDLAYDYLDGEYYRYPGQPPQDRRAREQDGYRDGVLHTRPRGYYHRRYYNYYDNGCGCSRRAYYRVYNSWGEHEYRQIDYSGYRQYDRYDRRNSYSYSYYDPYSRR